MEYVEVSKLRGVCPLNSTLPECKDNSGDYAYVKNGDGKPKLDKYGHLIVDHDLHNHKGELPDGIAEAFIEWARKEKLSFWRHLNGK